MKDLLTKQAQNKTNQEKQHDVPKPREKYDNSVASNARSNNECW